MPAVVHPVADRAMLAQPARHMLVAPDVLAVAVHQHHQEGGVAGSRGPRPHVQALCALGPAGQVPVAHADHATPLPVVRALSPTDDNGAFHPNHRPRVRRQRAV